jgi:peptide/nickel transport system permease protein
LFILRFLGKRLFSSILMLLGMLIFTFLLTRVIPANPAQIAAGLEATPGQVLVVKRELGLDRPLTTQLWLFLEQIFRGNFGRSFVTQRSVTEDIGLFFPATFELVAWAMILMTAVGVPLGFYAALGRSRLGRNIVRVLSYGAMGLPAFVLALLLQILFFGHLGWFPEGNRIGSTAPPSITRLYTVDALITGHLSLFLSALYHLVLPASALAISRVGMVARFTESQVLQTMRMDYIRTARAKGVRRSRIVTRHVLRNTVTPVIAVLGLEFGWLLGGSVLVESTYSWPGLGNYIVESVSSLDFNPVIISAFVLGVAFVVINLCVDVAQAIIDPRVDLS